MKQNKLIMDSWKGKDEVTVQESGEVYVLVSHRKNKETGEVKEIETKVPTAMVHLMYDLLRARCVVGKPVKYRQIVYWLNTLHDWHEAEGLSVDSFVDSFNGGGNRAKYYFPYYYNPIKVLELTGRISYLGRGGVVLKPWEGL